jgi:hypothetical protein
MIVHRGQQSALGHGYQQRISREVLLLKHTVILDVVM